jgi:nucleotide-binding universal stress UspA family protein
VSVVVGYHPSEEGRAAVAQAAAEARRRDLPLVAVDATRAGDGVPADLLAELRADGVPVELAEVDLPDPADRVLRAAQDRDAAVIVVGTRHRTAVGKFLLGSTAQRVLLEAAPPVLLVKAPA